MKLFVATDLHGSAYYTQKIVNLFAASGADTLVLLGDVYNHGPRNPFPRDYAPMKVAEMLNAIAGKVIAVQGNCDSEVDRMISNFPIVADNILPFCGRRLYFTHGHVYNKHNLPAVSAGDVVFYGHFHTNEICEVQGVTCVNVSSASLPKDVASYCIVDEHGVAIFDLDGNEILSKSF